MGGAFGGAPEEEDMQILEALKVLGIDPSKKSPQDIRKIVQTLSGKEEKPDPVIPPLPAPRLSLHKYPRFSVFYGEEGKGEVTWDTFSYEVQAAIVQGIFDTPQILAGVRRAVKGCASDKVRRLGVTASLDQVMSHLELEYGLVETDESIMRKFYSCDQKSGESVEKFASRLEGIHEKAVQLEAISPSNTKILKSRLHGGLRKDLRQASAYQFDKTTSYEQFKKEIRRIEAGASTESPIPSKPAVSTEKGEDSKFMKLLQQISDRIDKLEQKQSTLPPDHQEPRYRTPSHTSNRRAYNNSNGFGQDRGGRGRGKYQNSRPIAGKTFTPTCFLCGEKGHVQRNCPTILAQMICTGCKKKGHMRKDCPNL